MANLTAARPLVGFLVEPETPRFDARQLHPGAGGDGKDVSVGDEADTRYQFERQGYFCVDTVDSAPGQPVFNRTISLRDSWAKLEKKLR